MIKAALIIVGVVVVIVALLWGFQRKLIYFPGGAVPAAGSLIPGAREVTVTTSDGVMLGGWQVEGTRGVTVLVAGGNASDRAMRAPMARALAREGFSVLLMDYRGYGGNPGSPSEEGLLADARAFRSLVHGKVIYFGESLGCAVVTALAAVDPPDGLVLRSPFTSLADAGRLAYPWLPVRPLLRDRFPLAEQLASVRVPTTIVYGTRDTQIPPEMSRAVADAAGGPVTLVEVKGAGHNDSTFLDGPEILAAVRDLAA